MNAKTFSCVLVAICAAASLRAGTITNLVLASVAMQRTNVSVSLLDGQTATIIRTGGDAYPSTEFVEVIQGIRIVYGSGSSRIGQVFYGPSTLEFAIPGVYGQSGISALATLEIAPAPPGSVPVTNIPSNAVVIPADSAGPVTILLESSVDLITWNSAMPGTYGTSTTNRFFRVRAVR